MIEEIRSGGQTGADYGALLAARELGIKTGGWAPKGWRTEKGPNPDLASFGLREHTQSDYRGRTLSNVLESDGTLLFGDVLSPGSRQTLDYCRLRGKPYLTNPSAGELWAWLVMHEIKILNVAGNRESKHPGIQEYVRSFLVETLTTTQTELHYS